MIYSSIVQVNNPYATPIQPLYNPYTTPIQPLYNPYTRRTVILTLLQKFLDGSTPRRDKKGLASHGVIKGSLSCGLFYLFQKRSFGTPIPRVFSVMSVEATDAIRCIPVAAPSKVSLSRELASTMSFWSHDALIAIDGIFRRRRRRTQTHIERPIRR